MKNLGNARIHIALVVAFVFDNVSGNQLIGFNDQRNCALRSCLVKHIRNFPQTIEIGFEIAVTLPKNTTGGRLESLHVAH